MKKQKRDRVERAFNSGFKAGIRGRSGEQCPYESLLDLRSTWFNGWREGRGQQFAAGYLNFGDI